MGSNKRRPRQQLETTSIDALPQQALEHVLLFLTCPADRAAARLTCKQWRAAAEGCAEFWSVARVHGPALSASLREGGVAAKRGFLAFFERRAAQVDDLAILTSPDFFGFLCLLLRALGDAVARPSALRTLRIDLVYTPDRWVKRMLRDLSRLATLRSLTLTTALGDVAYWDVHSSELACLSSLTALESLHIDAYFRGHLPPSAMGGLQRLTSLRLSQLLYAAEPRLTMEVLPGGAAAAAEGGGGGSEGAGAGAGASASPLQHLDLCGFRLDLTAAQALVAFASLRSLRLHHVWTREGSWGALPGLPHLTAVTLTGGIFHQPTQATVGVVAGCAGLRELVVERYWQEALPELAPGSLRQLTRLRIARASSVQAFPPSWCQLGSLQSLEFDACLNLASFPPGMAALTSLQVLEIRYCNLRELPAELLPLSGLTRLQLACNGLQGLPEGPYLAQLRELDLSSNSLQAVPPPLEAATALRSVDLSSNAHLQVCKEGARVLGGLPFLETLDLRKRGRGSWQPGSQAGVLRTLQRRLRGVEVLVDG